MHATLSDELFGALAEAVAGALREMAGVESAPSDAGTLPGADLSAVLPVTTAAGTGLLALSLPEATATALARRILAQAETGVEPDAEVTHDCAGEIINVVAGQAKTLLYGTPYHFILSTPRVAVGAPDVGDASVIAFGSEVGEFALHVRLPV